MQCKHTLITVWKNYQPIDLNKGKRRVKSLCKTLIDVYSPVRKIDFILGEEINMVRAGGVWFACVFMGVI